MSTDTKRTPHARGPHGGARKNAGRRGTRTADVLTALLYLQRPDGIICAEPRRIEEVSGVRRDHARSELAALERRGVVVRLAGRLYAWRPLEFGSKPRLGTMYSHCSYTPTAPLTAILTVVNDQSTGFRPEFKFWSPRRTWWDMPARDAWRRKRGLPPLTPDERLRSAFRLHVAAFVGRVAERLREADALREDMVGGRLSAARAVRLLQSGASLRDLMDRAACCLLEREGQCHTRLDRAWGRDHAWDGEERGAWRRAVTAATAEVLPDNAEEEART